jgi:branched-chain amino acid transport system substrate-binding protein
MRNSMVKGKRLGIAILAITLATLLVLTACAPQPVVGEKEAQFTWIVPLTGPGASAVQMQLQFAQDYVRYFNERETIPGVRIEVLWRDTMMQTALFYSHYERSVAAGVPLILGFEFAAMFGLRERFERDGVVCLSLTSMQELMYPTNDWIYAMSPPSAEQAAAMLQYFMENWEEERPPRLAFVGLDQPFGQEPRYAMEYARSLGFEVLPPETVPIIVMDATIELLRLRAAGADLLFLQTAPMGTWGILRDAERLGVLDQFQFAGPSFSMGEKIMTTAGAAASEGFLIVSPYPWFDETEVPGIKLMIDDMMKYYGKVERDRENIYGWVSAAIQCEAISKAVENIGYDNLDGHAIKEGFDGMKDFDVYGLTSITYKPDDHRGPTKVAIYQVRGGEIVRVSDWREVPSGRAWEYE